MCRVGKLYGQASEAAKFEDSKLCKDLELNQLSWFSVIVIRFFLHCFYCNVSFANLILLRIHLGKLESVYFAQFFSNPWQGAGRDDKLTTHIGVLS